MWRDWAPFSALKKLPTCNRKFALVALASAAQGHYSGERAWARKVVKSCLLEGIECEL